VTAAGREAGGAETGQAAMAPMSSVPFDAVAAGYDWAMARVSEAFVPDLLAACALGAALELARTHRERASCAWANRLIGEIAASRNPSDAAAAEAYYQDALAAALELGMRPLMARCHLGLGQLGGDRGRSGGSETHLDRGPSLHRDGDGVLASGDAGGTFDGE
jgi:hypothetical protein